MGTRPIWLLDVDGVVNSLRPPPLSHGDYQKTKAWAANEMYSIRYSPRIVERINAIHRSGQVDIRWLTTWGMWAVASLGPEIGLDTFSFCPSPEGVPVAWVLGLAGWKIDAAEKVLDEENPPALIWTDDDLSRPVRERIQSHYSGRTLVLAPHRASGLTMRDLDRVEEFLTPFPVRQ